MSTATTHTNDCVRQRARFGARSLIGDTCSCGSDPLPEIARHATGLADKETGECDRAECFCHEAQGLESARPAVTPGLTYGFEQAWNSAPQAYRRLVEQEIAEYFYLRGRQDEKREVVELVNGDLRELVRLAGEGLR